MSKNQQKIACILAEFDNPASLLHAARKLVHEGYGKFDCHSPFPIHGMDEAMKLKRSPLGYMVGGMAFLGALLALWLQGWSSTIAYPIVISGKPFFSFQAFGPVTFGVAVLLGALTAVFGMLVLSMLPIFYHPLFHSDHFQKVTDDGFFISVPAGDKKFDVDQTTVLLASLGGKKIEILHE